MDDRGSIPRFAIPSPLCSNVFFNYWNHFSRIKGHECVDDNLPSVNADVWNVWNFIPTHFFRCYYVGVGTGTRVRKSGGQTADGTPGFQFSVTLLRGRLSSESKPWGRMSSIANCQLASHLQMLQTSNACILFASQGEERNHLCFSVLEICS
jgi:hypothetical protein